MSAESPIALKTGAPIDNPRTFIGFEPFLREVNNKRKVEIVPFSFAKIQEVLRKLTGVVVPDELSDQLGFRDINWYLFAHPNYLGLFFAGSKDKLTSLDDAITTLHLDREISNQKLRNAELRMAGIIRKTSPRILALEYDIPNNKLRGIGLSLKLDELERAHQAFNQIDFTEIPSQIANPYYTVAYITSRMVSDITTDVSHRRRLLRMQDSRFDKSTDLLNGFILYQKEKVRWGFGEPTHLKLGNPGAGWEGPIWLARIPIKLSG